MTRTTTLVMVLGLALGIGCKKQNDTSASEAPKTQETTGAKAPATAPAPAASASASASSQAGVSAGGIEHPAEEGAAAMLVAVSGTVEVERVGEPTWTAAKADTKLYAGDRVRTADQGAATIMLADQSAVEVGETSTVAIGSRDGAADPGASVAVLAGVARLTVTARTPGESAFRVYTPSSVVFAASGTVGVGVTATGASRIGVETGSVDVVGITGLDLDPVHVVTATQVAIGADGKVGTPSTWTTDDWGTWRDAADAKLDLVGAFKVHGDAMTELDGALATAYGDLQSTADANATFEATASAAADKNDAAAYTAALPEGAAAIDASFALAGRVEALTWSYAGHATLATDLYVRHPAELQASWDAIVPRVDASVLWPKRFAVTSVAYLEPLRTQYYVHHPVGRAHAPLVGITVPRFYAAVQPPAIDPVSVKAKAKGSVWVTPSITYAASARPVWIAAPAADWSAHAKVAVAAPRANVAWYVRPATLTSTAFIGAPVTGTWKSTLQVGAPEPRAALVASWKIPVGTKIRVDAPDLNAAATARAHAKLDGDVGANMKAKAKGNVTGKVDAALDVKAPTVAVPAPPAVDVKAKTNAAVQAGADVKSKVDGAVKASATVKAPAVKVEAPSVKVDAKAKAGFKLGN